MLRPPLNLVLRRAALERLLSSGAINFNVTRTGMKSISWAFIFEWLKQWHLFHALEISAIRLAGLGLGLKALGHHCRFFKNSFERRFFSRFFSKGAARRNTYLI
jgi:hypothetical protein